MSAATTRNILLIGLAGNLEEPDYLKGRYGSGEEVAAKIRADVGRAEGAGFRCTPFRIDPASQAQRVRDLEALLLQTQNQNGEEKEKFDAVMFGAGLRFYPAYSVLFETLVDVCRRHLPREVPFLFNTGPDTIFENLQRAFA
ncbi:hypothetical protein F5X96DRAFT_639441 [Biscogniauxia mediterranea]|nr:hypothetical protein F5X96DRAFT_639441 [Biscogniauxia mediterranea]